MSDNTEERDMQAIWTDDQIREGFIDDGGLAEYHDPIHGAQIQRLMAGEIFDRWLAAHDARIRAEREPVERAARTLDLDAWGMDPYDYLYTYQGRAVTAHEFVKVSRLGLSGIR